MNIPIICTRCCRLTLNKALYCDLCKYKAEPYLRYLYTAPYESDNSYKKECGRCGHSNVIIAHKKTSYLTYSILSPFIYCTRCKYTLSDVRIDDLYTFIREVGYLKVIAKQIMKVKKKLILNKCKAATKQILWYIPSSLLFKRELYEDVIKAAHAREYIR